MTELLRDRVALITGAARGQGRAHALRLAREGADIIAVDIAGPLPEGVPYDSATPDDLDQTATEVKELGRRAVTAAVDIRDHDGLCAAVDDAVSQLGRIDTIVANAGICIPQPWNQITAASFRTVIDTNVTGTWNTVMAGAHHIIDGGRGGSVVLISSLAGVKMQPFMVHYTASKHALTGMTRAFAAELGPHNIRVNSVHPGAVLTEMGGGNMIQAIADATETIPALSQMGTPFLPQWVMYPEDIAAAVTWLASDEARFITGVHLSVDSGMSRF
jgi:SDR family mycofactocin-dependent oxidoreductase